MPLCHQLPNQAARTLNNIQDVIYEVHAFTYFPTETTNTHKRCFFIFCILQICFFHPARFWFLPFISFMSKSIFPFFHIHGLCFHLVIVGNTKKYVTKLVDGKWFLFFCTLWLVVLKTNNNLQGAALLFLFLFSNLLQSSVCTHNGIFYLNKWSIHLKKKCKDKKII